MQMPNVKNTIVDSENETTYDVIAYRTLTREELVLSVRHYWLQKKKSKVRRGSTITIVTIIGHNG
jgi:hypothetical protein